MSIQVKNFMEDAVLLVFENVLKDMNVCMCDKCLSDIFAMTLNSLPNKYFVTDKGALFQKVNILVQQYEIDITTAIVNAAKTVNSNRRHD